MKNLKENRACIKGEWKLTSACTKCIERGAHAYADFYTVANADGEHRVCFLTGWLLAKGFEEVGYAEQELFNVYLRKLTGLPVDN